MPIGRRAAPHLIPEATSSASAEPGHPQILLRRPLFLLLVDGILTRLSSVVV
jgi:hypothetical protein